MSRSSMVAFGFESYSDASILALAKRACILRFSSFSSDLLDFSFLLFFFLSSECDRLRCFLWRRESREDADESFDEECLR